VSLFESLTAEEVARLAKRLSRHEYEVDQRVLAVDKVPDCLFIIHSGVMSVTLREASGEREIGRAGPGEAFGEEGLLAGLPMHVSITTLTASVVFQLDKDDMTSFLKEHPEVAKQLCQLLARRQDELGQMTTPIPTEHKTGPSLFQWFFGKVRNLHSLHDSF
jgi:CRP-like cAMP-binding protein